MIKTAGIRIVPESIQHHHHTTHVSVPSHKVVKYWDLTHVKVA